MAWEVDPSTKSLGKVDMSMVRIKFSLPSTMSSSFNGIVNDVRSLPAVSAAVYGPES